MGRLLTNPLQLVIDAIARRLPSKTEEIAGSQSRGEGNIPGLVILADVSGSMAEMAGGKSKHAILQDALDAIAPGETIAFSSIPYRLDPGAPMPLPHGSTALHLALRFAHRLRPRQTIVVSDGHPDDAAAALRAADALGGRIDVIYVGPDDDATALAFMRELARRGGGQVVVRDLVRGVGRQTLGRELEQLALPAPNQSRRS